MISNHSDWDKKIQLISPSELQREINSFNNSIIFPRLYKDIKSAIDYHQRIGIRSYHISDQLYLSRTYFTFDVMQNSPFIERVNEIVHSIHSAGLFDKWRTDRNINGMKLNFAMRPKDADSVDSFPIPKIILIGCIAGCVVFVIEIVWTNIKMSKRMRRCLKVKV